jgi:hypothetical protein
MEKHVALFFKRLEAMEAWDVEGKAVISSVPRKKPLVPQQQGGMECTYYMMLNLF